MERSSIHDADENVLVSSTTTSETVQLQVGRILCMQKKLLDGIKNQHQPLGDSAGTIVVIDDLAEACSLLTDYALHLNSRDDHHMDYSTPSTTSTPTTSSRPINSSRQALPTSNYRSLFGDDSDGDSIQTDCNVQMQAPQQSGDNSVFDMPTLMEMDEMEEIGNPPEEPTNIEVSCSQRMVETDGALPNKIRRNARNAYVSGKFQC